MDKITIFKNKLIFERMDELIVIEAYGRNRNSERRFL